MASLMDQSLDMDKLSCDIFSILESKFLSSNSPLESPLKPLTSDAGKVRILSIDAAADGGLLAALSLSRLEALLRKHSSDPSASVADYFDIAAGSGSGGVLAAMLFTRGHDGRPLFTAEQSFKFLNNNKKKGGKFRKLLSSKSSNKFNKLFGDARLRQDSIKPLLISCFDLLTASPFMFSRSDAVECDGFDFLMKDICAATCADEATEVKSVDRRTGIKAIGGGIGMGNPTAAAITHVLNNKREFPLADGPEDLLVVSLGSAAEAVNFGKSTAKIAMRIAGEGTIDTVDQSVAMALGQKSSTSYVRIQANGTISGMESLVSAAEMALSQRHIESVMFRGKKISEQTNGERIEWVSSELIKEQDRRRKKRSMPMVLIKPALATPTDTTASLC